MRTLAAVPLAVVLLASSGCLTAHPPTAVEGGPVLTPEAFFAGRTTGLGVLAVRGQRPQTVRVTSDGAWDGDVFRLDQHIERGGEARDRTWVMERAGPRGYLASLTDARGPVAIDLQGNTMRVRYRMGALTTMHQRLVLQPDRRTVLNLSTVRLLGVPVARLTETIRRETPVETGSPAAPAR